MKRIGKLAGYAAWFFACLFLFIYTTLPINKLRATAEDKLEEALGRGKQGRYGVDPVVQIGKLKMSGLGVKAERVSIQLASKDPDPGATLVFDDVAGSVSLPSIFFGDKTFNYDANLYTGNANGSLSMSKLSLWDMVFGKTKKGVAAQPAPTAFELDVDGVDISRVLPLVEKIGLPLAGKLVGTVSLDFTDDPGKNAEGEIDLRIKGVTMGPGELKIPVPGLAGGLSMPLVDLGDVIAQIDVDKGKGKTKQLAVTGRDVKVDVDGTIQFNKRIKMSTLRTTGWFQLTESFLSANGKFKALLDLVPMLKRAKEGEGKYAFSTSGSLSRPNFKLGKSAKKRK